MKQNLLKKMFALCLLVGASALAAAQTMVYGCMNGWSMVSFDLDQVNTGAKLAPTTMWPLSSAEEVNCGVSAGDYYYAFYTDANYEKCLGSFNFTTGEVVKMKSYTSEDDLTMVSMAYDANTQTLYGLQKNKKFDDEGRLSVTAELLTIDTSNGTTKVLASYEMDPSYDAIAITMDGKIYWVHNYTKSFKAYTTLYTIGADHALTTVFENVANPASCTYNNSALALADGKLLFVSYSTVLTIDPAAQTVVKKGSLTKFVAGLSFTASTKSAEALPEEAKPSQRRIVRTLVYGDMMGTVPADVDMSMTEYFYDSQLRTVRVINSGRGYDDEGNPADYQPMSLIKYNYASDGLSASNTRYQYGQYDFGDFIWKEGRTETSTYDEEGRLVKATEGTYYYTYEYDEEGNTVKSTCHYASSGNVSQEWTYSDFVGKNKPKTIVSTGAYDSYKYTSTCEYDENGNKVSELQVYAADGTKKQYETWKYDGNFLRQYNQSVTFTATGKPKPYRKRCYWLVDENDPNRIMRSDSTYFESLGRWTQNDRMAMDVYADFEGMDKKTAVNMTLSLVEDKPNTVKVALSVPDAAYDGACSFGIYRDGQLINTVALEDMATDEGDTFGGVQLAYEDEGVRNGGHEYFVQVLCGADENSLTGYCVSNVDSITCNVELPAVTDLKVTGYRRVVSLNGQTEYITLSWTNPEYPEEYGFVSNSIYAGLSQFVQADTTDATVNSMEMEMYYEETDVYVMTRYKFGKVKSEPLHVVLKDVIAGIDNVNAASAGTTLNGRMLTVARDADVTVHSFDGRLAARASNTRSVNLGALQPGAYLISVTVDGKTTVDKVVLK